MAPKKLTSFFSWNNNSSSSNNAGQKGSGKGSQGSGGGDGRTPARAVAKAHPGRRGRPIEPQSPTPALRQARAEAISNMLLGGGRPMTSMERSAAAHAIAGQDSESYTRAQYLRAIRHLRNPCVAARALGIHQHVRGCKCQLNRSRPSLLPRGEQYKANRMCCGFGTGAQNCF